MFIPNECLIYCNSVSPRETNISPRFDINIIRITSYSNLSHLTTENSLKGIFSIIFSATFISLLITVYN